MISVILSGGRNSRYPTKKGFIEVQGRPIIERNLELLRELTGQVVISTNEPELYFHLRAPLIGDVTDSSGPMSGIYSALYSTGAEEVLVTACDMPFLNNDLLRYIIENKGSDATVPVFNGNPEPLVAVYSRRLMPVMQRLLKSKTTSLIRMLKETEVKFITEDEVRSIDPDGRCFVNINTVEEYEKEIQEITQQPN